jgi:hypothetical protein
MSRGFEFAKFAAIYATTLLESRLFQAAIGLVGAGGVLVCADAPSANNRTRAAINSFIFRSSVSNKSLCHTQKKIFKGTAIVKEDL